MKNFKFDLGATVRCNVTGLKGVIIGRTDWLANCNTYGVKPKSKGNAYPETQWFDEPLLKEVKKGAFRPQQDTGGPIDTPKQTNR